jgi:hypothetical protein
LSVTRDAQWALPHPRRQFARAPKGQYNGNWRGGFYSQKSQAERRRLRELIRQMRATMDELP